MPALRGIVLVTGTDTGVGKTVVTAAIAVAAAGAGLKVAVIKPAQTGEDSDETVVRDLSGIDSVSTLVSYPDPLAPAIAAWASNQDPLTLEMLIEAVDAAEAQHDLVLVEGAGGLLVPMGENWTMADFAMQRDAPAVVVARPGLGTLNHTELTLEALHHREIDAYPVFGSWPARPHLVHMTNLAELAPLYGIVPENAGGLAPEQFRREAPGWLTPTLHGTWVST